MHKMDMMFSTYQKRIAFAAVMVVMLGAPLWIGQIKVGNLLLSMKTTEDLFNLTESSIVSAMFATRFFASYLSGSLTIVNLFKAFVSALHFAGILWLTIIVYLATMHTKEMPYKAVRGSAMGIFALQGILYVLIFYGLSSAYNAGSGREAATLLSTLGFSMIAFTLIEAFMATLVALLALLYLFHAEKSECV